MQISLKKVEHYTLKNDNYNKNLEITYKNRKKKQSQNSTMMKSKQKLY